MIESLAIFMAIVAGFLLLLVVVALPLEAYSKRNERFADWLDRLVEKML